MVSYFLRRLYIGHNETYLTTKGRPMSKRKHYGFGHLLLDFILTMLTGGLWLIWIIIRFLRSNSRY